MIQNRLTTIHNRRLVLTLVGVALLVATLGRFTAFATEEPDATMGYPTLTVTMDEKTITVPEQVPAGLTLATVKNLMPQGGAHMIWGRVPDDVSKDALQQVFQDQLAFEAQEASGTPPAGEHPLMPMLRQMTIVGGPDWAVAGKDAQGIVNLTPGIHVLINVFGSQSAVFDVVAPGPDAKTEEPDADVTVQLGNMAFVGLDQGVPAGKHLWKVENIDSEPHELVIMSVKPGTTEQQLLEQMQSGNDDEPFAPVGGISILTAGQTGWQVLDLAPGSYVALCMVPMDWNGPPHAFMGMLKVFEAK